MPIVLTWHPHQDDPKRFWLRGRNNTIGICTEITVTIPESNRGGFYFPGPLAIQGVHNFWLPSESTPRPSVANMRVNYTCLGLEIEEPVLPVLGGG